MQNEYRTLIVIYPDNKDINLSMLKDDLNNVDIQQGIKDRKLHLEYIRKGDQFQMELVGYDGEVKYEGDKYFENFFEHLFGIIDNMPIGKVEKEIREDMTESVTEGNFTRDDYLKMKKKYLDLKAKILSK